jgi:uncharacterized protein
VIINNQNIMKTLFLTLIFFLAYQSVILSQDYQKTIIEFQNKLNEEFRNPDESPLTLEDREKFDSLDFFPIDEKFRVVAKFETIENAIPFEMKTTTDRLPVYEIYGVATFNLDDIEYKLNIYQSHSLREKEDYKSYLFLPFTDATNGVETYGGGRFVDLEIPEGDQILIDFNMAYNPYCAYNHSYSCPIPPEENDLNCEIRAGVRLKY